MRVRSCRPACVLGFQLCTLPEGAERLLARPETSDSRQQSLRSFLVKAAPPVTSPLSELKTQELSGVLP